MTAYIINDDKFRYDLILGRNWLKRCDATPHWPTNSWFVTDPDNHTVHRLLAATVQTPSLRTGTVAPHLVHSSDRLISRAPQHQVHLLTQQLSPVPEETMMEAGPDTVGNQ